MNKVKIRTVAKVLSLVWLALLTTGCEQAGAGGQTGNIADRQIKVVATTSMITDMVKIIGGERVSVEGLMGAGVDPHLFKASAGAVNKLQQADIIFYNGLHLEAAMGEVLEQMHGRTTVVAVAEKIDKAKLLAPPEFKGAYDPHVWFDVTMWMTAVEQARDALAEFDPGSAEKYRANTETYLEDLRALHDYVTVEAKKVPDEKRVIITAHDAFNYFGRAYGFEVRGLQGISTVSEAGAADVQNLADFIAEKKIPAIFVESSVPPRTIEALQAAVKSRGFDVKIGGQLYSDALGNPGTPDGTYIGMVKHNVDTIVAALSK